MATEKEAVVKARLDGADEVASGFGKIKSAATDASGGVSKGWKDAGGVIKDSIAGVLSDVAHVVTAAGAISFAGAVAQSHQFEESIARMGVASKRSIESVKDGVNALSTRINEMPTATEAWVQSVGKLTYNYEGAASAAQGAAEYAAAIGDSIQEVAPLTAAIEELTGASGQAGRDMAIIVAQAERLGTVGGPRAVSDSVQHLRAQLSGLVSDMPKATALIAGFGGNKGFTAPQRERALGNVLSKVEGNPLGFERFLGHSVTDEFGHVKDVTGTLKELAEYGKRGRGQQRRLEFTFGKEATSALLHTDFAAIHRAESAEPSTAPARALERLKQTPAGERKANEIKKQQALQDVVGAGSTIGDISDWIGKQAGDHPILTSVGTALGANVLAKLAPGALGAAGKFFAGGGAGGSVAAEGASGAGIATGLGVAGAATVGVLAGGVLATVKTLEELGAASKVKQGFEVKALGYKEAEAVSARAKSAAAEADSHLSPGMQDAMRAERARKEAAADPWLSRAIDRVLPVAAHQRPGATPSSASPQEAAMKATIEQLVKAGASLQLAQETAAKLLSSGQPPIQIEVVNATGGEIDAHVRGEQ